MQDSWRPNHAVVLGTGALGAVEEPVSAGRLGLTWTSTNRVTCYAGSAKGGKGANQSGLCRDILNQRPTEIDYINGAAVKLGRQHGIPTPINQTFVATVKGLQSHYVPVGTQK